MVELTVKNLVLTAITILLIFHLKNYSHSWKIDKLAKSSTSSDKVKKLTKLQLLAYSPAILVYLVGKFLNLAFKIIIYTILDCSIWVLDKALESDFKSIVVKVKDWSLRSIESVKGLGIKVGEHLSHLYWTNYHDNLVNLVNYVQLEFNNLSIKVVDYSVKFKNYSITQWNTIILPKLNDIIDSIIIPLVNKLYQISSRIIVYLNTSIIPAIKTLDFSKLFSLIQLEYIIFNLIPKLLGYTLGGIKFLITHSNYLFSLTKLKELAAYYYPIIVHKLEQGSIKALDWLESDGLPKLKQFIVYFAALSKSLFSKSWDKFCYSLEFHIVPLISHLINTIPKIYNWANDKYNQVKPIVYSVWINQLLPLISKLGELSTYLNIAFGQAYVELRDISTRLVVMANDWYDSIRELDGIVEDKAKKNNQCNIFIYIYIKYHNKLIIIKT